MSVSVCLCVRVFVREHDPDPHVRSSPDISHVIYGRGSVLLSRRSDKSCSSVSVDDVIFAHSGS